MSEGPGAFQIHVVAQCRITAVQSLVSNYHTVGLHHAWPTTPLNTNTCRHQVSGREGTGTHTHTKWGACGIVTESLSERTMAAWTEKTGNEQQSVGVRRNHRGKV